MNSQEARDDVRREEGNLSSAITPATLSDVSERMSLESMGISPDAWSRMDFRERSRRVRVHKWRILQKATASDPCVDQ